MTELAVAAVLGVQSAMLSAGLLAAWRANRYRREAARHAAEAEKASKVAWLHTANIEHTAERLNDLLPPDVIPFPTEQLPQAARPSLRIADTGEPDYA